MRAPVSVYSAAWFLILCGVMGAIGALCLLLSGVVGTALFPGLRFEQAMLPGGLLAFPLAFYVQHKLMRAVRRRLTDLERRRAAEDVVAYEAVQAPFTLYLRAFTDDSLQAAQAPRPLSSMRDNRYETKLISALAPIGPVVAVGAPGEELPPSGARRLYLDHTVWQDRVRSLMERARAVVIVVGETEGVWWEIENVFEIVDPARVALVFPVAEKTSLTDRGLFHLPKAPKPRQGPEVMARLDAALGAHGLGPAPTPKGRDHVLVFGPGGARFLRSRMTWFYWSLKLNPATWVGPFRNMLAAEFDYAATFRPFVRAVRASGS